MTSKKRILLLRSNEDRPDPYEAQLQSDYEVIQVPVLQFQYIHQENLIEKLKSPEKYNSIVFTSVRSVEAVAKVTIENDPSKNCLLESWHSKKCYVVGESTYSKVLDTLRWKSRWDSSLRSGFLENV